MYMILNIIQKKGLECICYKMPTKASSFTKIIILLDIKHRLNRNIRYKMSTFDKCSSVGLGWVPPKQYKLAFNHCLRSISLHIKTPVERK